MKLSIVIPVFNEENTIKVILDKVKNVKISIQKEIIVVDDCSTDKTQEIMKKISGLKVLFHEKNQGKGASVRDGLANATGDIVIIQDADLEYDPEDYPKLIEPILSGKAKVVYGSRYMSNKPRYWLHYFGTFVITGLTNFLYRTKLSDVDTCYKMFRADVIKNLKLKENRFNLDHEVTAKVLKRGYSIYEVPISYKGRSYNEGKKIKWRDGLRALFCLLYYRFFE